MHVFDEYIEEATKLIRLCIDKKNESQEAIDLEKKLAVLWKKMSEEEQFYATEQTLRISMYLSPN